MTRLKSKYRFFINLHQHSVVFAHLCGVLLHYLKHCAVHHIYNVSFIQPRSWLLRSSGGGATGGSGNGGAGGSGSSKPTGSGRQMPRTRARIMRSNTAIRGGSNSGELKTIYSKPSLSKN